MGHPNKAPTLNGEQLYIPFVGAIIERELNGELQILLQTRDKDSDKKYSGSIEMPGGKFRAFEDVYESLKREVSEESGLKVVSVKGEDRREDYKGRDASSSLIYPYCVTQIKEGPFLGLVFLCQAKGVPARKTDETTEARWVSIEELKRLLDEEKEKIYPPFLAAMIKYCREH